MKYQYNPEERRLMADHRAVQQYRKFSAGINSKRRSKHPSVGQVLKNSRIHEQVGLEVVFTRPGWVKQKQLERWGKIA